MDTGRDTTRRGRALRLLRSAFPARFWPILAAVLTVAFIILVVRPLETQPDPDADDVATAWNNSIARLGIVPVFPPQEDLHVGDLWGVIESSTEDRPLLGKAVRLTHIDMRDLIEAGRKNQPVFSDTARGANGEPFVAQARNEVADAAVAKPIPLSLTAFPGISIRHSRRATGSLLTRMFGGVSASREGFELEEIRIPVAETYGVDAAKAIGYLDAWCQEPETRLYCSDEFVRRVVAFAVSDRVMAVRDGRYAVRLQLLLVTRAFLTREIDQSRVRDVSSGAASRVALDRTSTVSLYANEAEPPRRPEGESQEARDRAALDARDATNRAALQGGAPASSVAMFSADGTRIDLRQVFQRPVAIGFRAITIRLKPASPPSGTSE